MQQAAPSKTQQIRTLSPGMLSMLAVIDCMSSSASEGETMTETAMESSVSPVPSETGLPADLSDFDDPSTDEVQKILESFGITDCTSQGPLLLAPGSSSGTLGSEQQQLCHNLFWKMLDSQQQHANHKFEQLALLNKNAETCVTPQDTTACSMGNGEWLWHFKMCAMAVPVKHVATCILGDDVGNDLACFIGIDDLGTKSEYNNCPVVVDDPAHGERVIGSRNRPCVSLMGHGRLGFLGEDEVSISTPGHSSPRFMATETLSNDLDACEDSFGETLF